MALHLGKDSRMMIDIVWPYVLLTAILVGIFCCAFLYGSGLVSDNRQKLIAERFDTISETANQTISNYMKLCDVMASNAEVRLLMEGGAIEELKEQIPAMQMSARNILEVSNVDADAMLLYFPHSQLLVQPDQYCVGLSQCSDRLTAQTGSVISTQVLDDIPLYDSWSIFYGNAHGWLVRAIYDYREIHAFILLGFRCGSLVPQLAENEIVLIGNDEQCVYSGGMELDREEYSRIREAIWKDRKFTWNGSTYQARLIVSSMVRMDIMVGVPQNIGLTTLSRLQRLIIILGCVCCTALLLVFLSLYRRVLLPVRILSQSAPQTADGRSFREMLAMTQEHMQTLRRQSAAAEKERKFLLSMGVGEMLNRMGNAKKDGTMPRIAIRTLDLAGILPNQPYFVVGFLYLKDENGIFDEMGREIREITPFWVLNNVLTDLVFCERPGVLSAVDKYYMVLAVCKEGETQEEIQKIIRKCLNFYLESYHVTLAATAPALGRGAEQLKQTVEKACKEIQYLDFWRKSGTDAQPDAHTGNPLYFKYLRNMVIELDSRDYVGAHRFFQQIMDECLPAGTWELSIVKYRLFGMIETLIASIPDDSRAKEPLLASLSLERRLYNISTIEEFRAEAESIFRMLIDNSQASAPREDTDGRILGIRRYIDEHFCESTLASSTLMERFDISGSYLSREFKRVTGSNLLDYIQRLRVERAKELLQTQSVKSAAANAGFSDTQALSRAFRKYEGITPGEYKKMMENG